MAVFLLLLAYNASAQLVNVQITGHVTVSSGPGSFIAAFPVGSSYSANFSFVTGVADSDARSSVGIFVSGASSIYPFDITLTLNGLTFSDTRTTSQLTIYNNATDYGSGDGFYLNYGARTSPTVGGFQYQSTSALLYTSNTSLYANDSMGNVLGSAPYSLDGFDVVNSGGVSFSQGFVNYHIDSIAVSTSAIPEASTYALFAGLGMLGFVVLRRWRRAARAEL